MDNSNLIEATIETDDTFLKQFLRYSQIKIPDEARIYNFVKDFLVDSLKSDGSL